jgi:hypothetical protein
MNLLRNLLSCVRQRTGVGARSVAESAVPGAASEMLRRLRREKGVTAGNLVHNFPMTHHGPHATARVTTSMTR